MRVLVTLLALLYCAPLSDFNEADDHNTGECWIEERE